jgi:hypothetical protein
MGPPTPLFTHTTGEDDPLTSQGTSLSKRLMPLGQHSSEIPAAPLMRPSTTTESRASSGFSRTLPRLAVPGGTGYRASSVVSPASGMTDGAGGDGHVDSAVATYLNATTTSQRQHLMSSCVVLVQMLPHLDLLATADEKGSVSLWDVRPCLKHCSMYVTDPMAAPSTQGAPNLIRWWRAHEDEITAMKLMQDPEDEHTVFLVTASNDKTICIWSADGVLLGNLALGREDGAKVLPAGVHPYLFRDARRKEHWAEFDAYLERRDLENTPLSAALMARSVPPPPMARVGGASGRGSMPPRAPGNATSSLHQMNMNVSHVSGGGAGPGSWSAGSTPLPFLQGPDLGEFSPIPEASSSPAPQTLLHVATNQQPRTSTGDGTSFFLTHTEVGASSLEPTILVNSSSMNVMARLQADRFGGIVKRSMIGTTPLKLDQIPRHLAHTGALTHGTVSPRRVTTALPVLSPRTPNGKTPSNSGGVAAAPVPSADRQLALSSRSGGGMTKDDGDASLRDSVNHPLPSLPPSSPRRPPVSADPPQPHRPAVSQQSQRMIRQCVRRYEPKTAEEFLRRNGRITLRFPGSPSRGGAVNDGSVWGDDGGDDNDGATTSNSPTLTVTALSTLGSPSTVGGKGRGVSRGLDATPSSPVPPRTAPSGYLPGNSLEVLETPSFRSLKAVLK